MPRHGLAVTFVVRNMASFEKASQKKPLFFSGNQNCFSPFETRRALEENKRVERGGRKDTFFEIGQEEGEACEL